MWLFLALVAVPIIEIALFIEVGGWIGLWPTLALVVLTAVAGTYLLRAQGLSALARLQDNMARGGDPFGPLAEGAAILFAGALLLTPGFFTDAAGFLLLAPPTRRAILGWLGPRLARRMVVRRAGPQGRRPEPGPIDAEYRDVTPDAPTGGRGVWTPPEG